MNRAEKCIMKTNLTVVCLNKANTKIQGEMEINVKLRVCSLHLLISLAGLKPFAKLFVLMILSGIFIILQLKPRSPEPENFQTQQ